MEEASPAARIAAHTSVFVLIIVVLCYRVYAHYLRIFSTCQYFFLIFLNNFVRGVFGGKLEENRGFGMKIDAWEEASPAARIAAHTSVFVLIIVVLCYRVYAHYQNL